MLHKFLTLVFITLLSTGTSFAQSEKVLVEQEEINPIIRTLDSLENIDPIYRYKNILLSSKLNIDSVDRMPIPSFTDAEYQTKFNSIVSPIRLDYNQTVKNYIEVYAKHARRHTSKIIGLSDLYFPMFEEALDREGLPLELKYLAIVESALNPNAVSRSGATGLWQFMYNTGRAYELQIDSYIDDRRDPYKSTQAAIEYFKDMYRIYGDWHLVIASYNCGPGNVNKAIRRAGGETNFWKIKQFLPRETRGYLPAFLAVTYLFNHLEDHNLYVTEAPYTYFELDTVMLPQSISFNSISDAVNLPIEVIKYLNPAYKRNVIPNTPTANRLVLPVDHMAVFDEKLPELMANSNELNHTVNYIKKKLYYRVKSGDNLSVIAQKHMCSVTDLKSWNNLRSSRIKAGQSLLVYTLIPEEESKVAETNSDLPEDNTFEYYTIQEGDTLWDIANRYDNISVKQLLRINNIDNHRRLRPGTKIKIKTTG